MTQNEFRLSDDAPLNEMKLVHVFFADVSPVFFLMVDEENNLYAVSLCDDRTELRWIVSPVSRSDVRRMIKDEITPRELFQLSGKRGKSFVVSRSNNETKTKCVYFDEIDKLDLPTEGMFFEAELEEVATFQKSMEVLDYTTQAKKNNKSRRWIEFLKKKRDRYCERMRGHAYSHA